jgi:hypothetical protein
MEDETARTEVGPGRDLTSSWRSFILAKVQNYLDVWVRSVAPSS